MFGLRDDDVVSGWNPELDTWYHLVFTYENSGSYTKSIYVDGALKATGPGNAYAYSGSETNLLIGRNYGPAWDKFYGFYGEIEYARGYTEVLSASDVAYLYDPNQPPSPPPPSQPPSPPPPSPSPPGHQGSL